MKHQIRTNDKRQAYIAAGYECGKVTSDENESVFFSLKDGIKRKHIFTNSSVSIEIIKDEPIEEVVSVNVSEESSPIKKKTRKKKGT
jgi:hypothetical protein